MYYNLTNEYDKVRNTIHDCIENALNTPILGVIDAEMTYGGTIGGFFLDATDEPYLYELDSEGVIFAPYDDDIRIDAAKGKKCPGGYWIPRDKECKRANMSPSAKKKAGGLKGALAAGLIAAGAAGAAGVGIKRAADQKVKDWNDNANRQLRNAGMIAGVGGAGALAYHHNRDKVNAAVSQGVDAVKGKAAEYGITGESIRKGVRNLKGKAQNMLGQRRTASRLTPRAETPARTAPESFESKHKGSSPRQIEIEGDRKTRKRVSQPSSSGQVYGPPAPRPTPVPAQRPEPAAPSGERKTRKRGSAK